LNLRFPLALAYDIKEKKKKKRTKEQKQRLWVAQKIMNKKKMSRHHNI
jgi:hypothetical protein